MPIDKIFRLASMQFPGSPAVDIGSITDSNISTQVELQRVFNNSCADAVFVAKGQRTDKGTLTTHMVDRALKMLLQGSDGGFSRCVSAASARYRGFASECDASQPTGRIITFSKSIVYWTQISAEQNQFATSTLEINPVVNSSGVTLTESTGTVNANCDSTAKYHTLGPVFINDTQLQGVQRVQIQCRVQQEMVYVDGLTQPVFNGIKSREFSVTIGGVDLTLLNSANIGLDGVTIGSAGLLIYLRGKQRGADNYAQSSEEHIRFTFNAGSVYPSQISGGENNPIITELTAEPCANTSGVVGLVETDVAIE